MVIHIMDNLNQFAALVLLVFYKDLLSIYFFVLSFNIQKKKKDETSSNTLIESSTSLAFYVMRESYEACKNYVKLFYFLCSVFFLLKQFMLMLCQCWCEFTTSWSLAKISSHPSTEHKRKNTRKTFDFFFF